MVVGTLVTAGLLGILTGFAFAFVGRDVSLRSASAGALLARRAHTTWWLGLGIYLVLQGTLTILAALGGITLEGYLASRVVAIPLLCVSVWGITFYLWYLYTGSTRAAVPLALLFGLVLLTFFYATYMIPHVLTIDAWLVTVDDTHPLYKLVYVLVGLPPIVSSVALLALLRKVEVPEQRYRITLLAGSILLYVGSGLAARLGAGDFIVFLTLVVFGLGAAAVSLAAYHPPPGLRRRLSGGAR